MSDASRNAMRVALSTQLISNGATLLHAFLSPAKGKMLVAGIDKEPIDNYVASERQRALDELVAFLIENNLSREKWLLRVEEGGPIEVIARAIAVLNPDLLVMGTNGRSSLMKALIGSVTEEALRTFSVDILAVPPPKR
jgi:nucleotide-binding universal stress UspA family protein